jgi:hypothetical protein
MDLVDKSNDAEQLLRNTEIDNYINRVRPQRISDSCIDCQYIYELKGKQGRL